MNIQIELSNETIDTIVASEMQLVIDSFDPEVMDSSVPEAAKIILKYYTTQDVQIEEIGPEQANLVS